MRRWKLSVNAAFFGRQADGYTEYYPDRTLEEKFDLVSQLEGVQGIELKYPFDLQDVERVRVLLERHGLALSAVNVDLKDAAYFRHGALSAQSAEARKVAVSRLQEGMDIAADLGTGLVTTCPLADGYDYPFEIDYTQAWDHFCASVDEAAGYRDDVRLVLEYQPHDMQSRPLLNHVGKMLYVCHRVGRPNLGANLDVGHSFAAGEAPAEAASLLHGEGRLFYMHSNDNTGDGGDWDMISGSVHLWHWLELLHTLDRLGYDGWIGADIKAHQMDAVSVFGANTRMLLRMMALLDRLDGDELEALVRRDGNTPDILEYLSARIFQSGV
ncbi:MAG TPA: sugar phosphate isomerase/epimerase [Chloroflexi bacterium]|jgi:xylose isomerase|nr:sugar phosphate isomerase/epimerase [Chloroflexota bacterium]